MDNLTINCGACRDLLPLIAEGMASEESEALAAAHLEGCEACRAELEQIKENPVPVQMPLDNSMRITRHKLRKKRLLTALISAVTAIALLCTGHYLLFKTLIFLKTPPSDLQCSVEDGVVTITAAQDSIYSYSDGRELTLEDGSKVYIIMLSMANPPARKIFPRLYVEPNPDSDYYDGEREMWMQMDWGWDGDAHTYRLYFIQERKLRHIEIDETTGKLTEESMQYATLAWEETIE